MNNLKLFLLIAPGFLIVPVLSEAQYPQQDFEKMEIRSSGHWIDIDYVGDGQIGHRLDIHLPEKELEKYPVIVSIYGSAWFSNNSKGATYSEGIGQALMDAGFAVVAINHRSSSEATFPAQIHDVKAAIRFVRANAGLYSLDPGFIGITGWSSGGHLAALTGTTNHLDTFELNGKTMHIEGELGRFTKTSSHVDAVVDWFGPANFLTMDECGSSMSHNDEKSPESSLIGGPIQSNKEKCHFADPATYANAETPPFLIFHGDEDPLVPHCQSEYLHDKLRSTGVESELVIVRGGKHGPGVLIPEHFQKMIFFFHQQRSDS